MDQKQRKFYLYKDKDVFTFVVVTNHTIEISHFLFYFYFSFQAATFFACDHFILILTENFKYRNFPKFSDRQVWANSANPDQTAPRGAV